MRTQQLPQKKKMMKLLYGALHMVHMRLIYNFLLFFSLAIFNIWFGGESVFFYKRRDTEHPRMQY